MRQYSVQALMDEVGRGVAERYPRVLVEGEVAQLTVAASGHAYLVLREPGATRSAATLSAVCWRSVWQGLGARPKPGDRVVVRGKLGVYAQRGSVQLSVLDIRPAGAGRMAQLIAERIARLKADGLLDPARKRPLPAVPRFLGLVASPTSAAVQDFLRVSGERYPATRILLAPAITQGAEAPSSVVRAMDLLLEDGRSELIVVTRGGGSKEDLMAFQDEQLARFVARCPVPVVSAVGHEIDTTLIDLVADVAVPTPTAAAVVTLPDGPAMTRMVDEAATQLERGMQRRLERDRQRLAALKARLRHPGERLVEVERRRVALFERLHAAMQRQLEQKKQASERASLQLHREASARVARERQRFAERAAALNALSPLAVLARGFAVVTHHGAVVTSASDVSVGDRVDVRLADGMLSAVVESS